MGLRMDDLHAPTVSSGPTSSGYSNGVPKDQLSLRELIAEKDRVEAELKALGQVLDSVRTISTSQSPESDTYPQHGVNMNTGLTTLDGFPRADIDVAQSAGTTHSTWSMSLTRTNSTNDASAHNTPEE